MSDKNQNPTPENTAQPTPPAPPAADAPTVPVEPTTAPAAAASVPAESDAAGRTSGRKRALLIGGGIAAALLLAGGGVAVGAAIGDEFGEDDDRPVASGDQRVDDDHDDDDRAARQDDAPSQGQTGQNQNGPVTGIGTDSADALVAIADAARGAADGVVTSIDAKRDGTWEVQLEDSTGGETEVRVDADFVATVVSTEVDDDDIAPALSLDEATIRALVNAALAEADGMITDLDVDDDASSPYDVSVLTSDRRSIDIDLSADFAVIGTDTDD